MTEHTINFKSFPTTRYQGSKRKILYWIYECIKEIKFNQIVDAFGGSGSVSYLAKSMGKGIIYNDLMKFNYLIGQSIIENKCVLVEKEDIDYVLNNKIETLSPSFIQDNFKDVYFLEHENEWLDKIISNINLINTEDGTSQFKRAILFNALFQSSLAKRPFNLFHRKNLYIRTADVERNFGNKATWEKSFQTHFLSFINQINNSIFDNNQNCLAVNKSVFELDYPDADCVYFDPPYFTEKNHNETSDYYRGYHFLEGIANYKDWGDRIDFETMNKRFNTSETTEHFSRHGVKESFEKMFLKFADKTIILSYKSGGNPSIEWLENILKKLGKRVSIKFIDYTYALNRNNKKGAKTVEALLIAK